MKIISAVYSVDACLSLGCDFRTENRGSAIQHVSDTGHEISQRFILGKVYSCGKDGCSIQVSTINQDLDAVEKMLQTHHDLNNGCKP